MMGTSQIAVGLTDCEAGAQQAAPLQMICPATGIEVRR